MDKYLFITYLISFLFLTPAIAFQAKKYLKCGPGYSFSLSKLTSLCLSPNCRDPLSSLPSFLLFYSCIHLLTCILCKPFQNTHWCSQTIPLFLLSSFPISNNQRKQVIGEEFVPRTLHPSLVSLPCCLFSCHSFTSPHRATACGSSFCCCSPHGTSQLLH